MDRTIISSINSFISIRGWSSLSKLLSNIPTVECKEFAAYILHHFIANRLNAKDFWMMMMVLSRQNFLIAKFILVDAMNNVEKNKRAHLLKRDKNSCKYFRNVFTVFVKKDKYITDILFLIWNYGSLIDILFLPLMKERSKEFNHPNAYQSCIETTRPTYEMVKKWLLEDNTITSLYALALLIIDDGFRNEYGWGRLSKGYITKEAVDIKKLKTPEASFVYNAIIDFVQGRVNPAADYLYNCKYKKFVAEFMPSGDSRNDRKARQIKSGTQSGYHDDINSNDSKYPLHGHIATLFTFRNNKVAFAAPFENYDGGILYPSKVTYNNMALPVDEACHIIRVLTTSGQVSSFGIEGEIVAKGKQFAILTKEMSQLSDDNDLNTFKNIKIGNKVPFSVVASTPHFKKVKVEGTELTGYIRATDFKKLSVKSDTSTFVAQVASKSYNEKLPIIFGSVLPHRIVNDSSIDKETEERYNNLFDPLELQQLKTEDKQLIDVMLAEYPSFGRSKEGNDIIADQVIYCRFDDSGINGETVLQNIKKMLLLNNFWVSPRTLGSSQHLFLFNENLALLDIEVRNHTFYLKGSVEHGANDRFTYQKIDKNKLTRLKISGQKIMLCGAFDVIPNDYDSDTTFLYIDRLNDYFKIKYDAWHQAILSVKDRTADFRNQQLYLEYQKDKELKKRSNQITVAPDRLSPISADWQYQSVSLKVDLDEEEYNSLWNGQEGDGEIDNEIRVNTIDKEGKIVDHCKLTSSADGDYIIEFLGQHKDITEYQRNGVTLQVDANIQHLMIQLDALKGFTHNDDTLFRDLLGGQINVPDEHPFDNIEFYNTLFTNVEEGNSQPIAVKKALALGHKGVLLIQGPPGTGKTTTIVEIIRQLVKRKKRVLVCSQSHAAVDNIYQKLHPLCSNILSLDDNVMDTKGFNGKDYRQFICDNMVLLERLHHVTGPIDLDSDDSMLQGFRYSNESINEQYSKLHKLLAQYYIDNSAINCIETTSLLKYLADQAEEISGSMLMAQIYQSKDVILGTCIGVGMNWILRDQSLHFDTVIIDEAAKANFAETIVPMMMGDRYILVGDDNQLPPYVERGQIEELVESNNNKDADNPVTVKEMINSQNKSLFEYLHYHKHPVFPEGCLVTLNYQYRMNPEIGNFISRLFYNGKIQNGAGTSKQDVFIPGYPNPVTVIDTSGHKGNHEQYLKPSHRNDFEARYICEEILPKIMPVLKDNPNLTLGIISPYASQCDYIRKLISDKELANCVHTIDSIQGMEYDIVIFSFVRSFSKKDNRKVGFVDDMKRLNVSLSRAKKKLIVIGNMSTLTDPDAHFENDNAGVKPLDVFKKLAAMPTKITLSKSEMDYFLSSGITDGTVLGNCQWDYENDRSLKGLIKINFTYQDRKYHFHMRVSSNFLIEKKTSDLINIQYVGLGKDSKPQFAFSSFEDNIKYAYKYQFEAKCLNTDNFPRLLVEVNGQRLYISIYNDERNKRLFHEGMTYTLQNSNSGTVSMASNLDNYKRFITNHAIGERLDGVVTGKNPLRNGLSLYFVMADGFACACVSRDFLEIGTSHTFVYNQFNEDKKQVTLKYFSQYDIE
jgi:Cdc6-like AAA superfamily ATPase